MREIITLSVGQAGNQIGWRFWDLVLREHAQAAGGRLDDSMSTFFHSAEATRALRARSVLIDTEEGVVNQILRSPLGQLFDRHQLVTDVSGAGNNW